MPPPRILPSPGPALAALTLILFAPQAVRADPLADLPRHKEFKARRESSYDRSGGNADARPIPPGATLTIAELQGPGCITHLWFTHLYIGRAGLRKLVLRAWFDGAETPCIEAPLGDFFGLGHAQTYAYGAQPLAVGTHGGLNSFWRMPFARSARLTVTNEGRQPCHAFYYYVDYETYDKPLENTAHFHAHYRQAMPCVKGQPYTILDARGRGHYVGCNLSIEQGEESWWGEGDDRFYIDGETTPSLVGTGSEDYFSGAWCYWNEFAYPYFGMPFRGRFLPDGRLDRYTPDLKREDAREWHWPVAWRKGDLWNVYRYHVLDPIPFRQSLRMEIEHGFINNERQDHYSSVAYWYQDEPHAPQPPLPPVEERLPVYMRLQDRGDGLFEGEDFADDPATTVTEGYPYDGDFSFWGDLASRDAVLHWTPETSGSELRLSIPVAEPGRYELLTTTVLTRRGGEFEVALEDQALTASLDLFHDSIFPKPVAASLGEMDLRKGPAVLRFRFKSRHPKSTESAQLSLDILQLRKVHKP